MRRASLLLAVLPVAGCSVLYEPGAATDATDATDASDATDAGELPLDAAPLGCQGADDDVFRYEVPDVADAVREVLPADAGEVDGRVLDATDATVVEGELAAVRGRDGCGAALEFSGRRYVEVAHVAAWELGEATLSFHYWPSLDEGLNGIVSKDLSGEGEGHITIFHHWAPGAERPRVIARVQGGSESGYVCSDPIDPDAWHEVIATLGDGTWRLYVDGELAQSEGSLAESGHTGDCQLDGTIEGDFTQNRASWIFGASGESRAASGETPGRFLLGNARLDHIRLQQGSYPPR